MKQDKLTVYLCGSMEFAEELGAGWRRNITPYLEMYGLKVLNPCEFEPEQLKGLKPNRLPEFYTDLHGNKIKPSYWHDLKNASEPHLYNRFLKYMRRIIHYDMRLVEQQVDYLIVLWDEAAGRGAGSHAEITAAFLKNIPIYCVATADVPAWIKGCCTEIFLDFDSLKKFLREEFGS